ncbi:MAG: hypothetical protein K2K59_07060, partial [Muribaculaceae bacterium]|nr:hypothetical protein [Muribaculaceae bacterium]
MKKFLLFFAALLPSLAASAQVSIPYQEIPYDVHYHWGLIDVMIAHGRATIQSDGQNFSATLDGNSIPWEGRVFCVSDTLNALMTPQASGPAREQVTYQNGWYLKPKVTVFNSGNFHPDDSANFRNIHGQGALLYIFGSIHHIAGQQAGVGIDDHLPAGGLNLDASSSVRLKLRRRAFLYHIEMHIEAAHAGRRQLTLKYHSLIP